MKKIVVALFSAALSFPLLTSAWMKQTENVQHTGEVVFEQSVALKGAVTIGSTVLTATAAQLNSVATGAVTASSSTYTATVAKAASAIQATTASYTATVSKAASALQPNSASYTSILVTADAKTNTVIVISGQVTSWVVTQ